MEVVRAKRPFKVQVKLGEFLHYRAGDIIGREILQGPYREFVLQHCERAETRAHILATNPERVVEPTANLLKQPPELKEKWKNVNAPVETAKGEDQPTQNTGPAKQATGGAHAVHASHAAPTKGTHTGKAKPHA